MKETRHAREMATTTTTTTTLTTTTREERRTQGRNEGRTGNHEILTSLNLEVLKYRNPEIRNF
jgi:hypothetical protein